jgi:hypothetical protein
MQLPENPSMLFVGDVACGIVGGWVCAAVCIAKFHLDVQMVK